jgi:hypothetical protein
VQTLIAQPIQFQRNRKGGVLNASSN